MKRRGKASATAAPARPAQYRALIKCDPMERSIRVQRFFVALIVCGLTTFFCAGAARADDEDLPSCNLQFVVVRDYNGKPIRNAAVVLHPVNGKGKQSRGGMELKTDTEGKTSFNG